MGRTGSFPVGEHRRQILRAVWCSDAYSNSYSQPDTHRNRNAYGHSYVYAYADPNPNSDSNRTQPDANTITDFYTNCDCGTWRN